MYNFMVFDKEVVKSNKISLNYYSTKINQRIIVDCYLKSFYLFLHLYGDFRYL